MQGRPLGTLQTPVCNIDLFEQVRILLMYASCIFFNDMPQSMCMLSNTNTNTAKYNHSCLVRVQLSYRSSEQVDLYTGEMHVVHKAKMPCTSPFKL